MGIFKKSAALPSPVATRRDLGMLLSALPETELQALSRAAPELHYLDTTLSSDEIVVALAAARYSGSAPSSGIIVLTAVRVIAVVARHDRLREPQVSVYNITEITDINIRWPGKNCDWVYATFFAGADGREFLVGSSTHHAQEFVTAVKQSINRARLG